MVELLKEFAVQLVVALVMAISTQPETRFPEAP
jgi:hypothetical protein